MSKRTRLVVNVVGAAVAAGIAATAIALYLGGGDEKSRARPGAPPLAFDLGVRSDPEAQALRRAHRLYTSDRREEARSVFARYSSVEAQVGEALAAWPKGSLVRIETLAGDHPRNAFVLLHLGFARFWAGDERGAIAAWREAARADRDSPSAARAEDLLFPNFPRGRPLFVPSFTSPADLERLSPPRQFAVLRRRARGRDVRGKLLYGLALQ